MRLNHNMNSLNLYRTYSKDLSVNESALSKISSGLKINSAKDNPNKIGQAESMRIKIKSLQAAQKNMQDGSSMLQVADGGLQEVSNILSRMKELAVSSADGTKTDVDRESIQMEIDELKGAINDLATNTEFNKVKLLGDEGVSNNMYPQYKLAVVGAEQGETMKVPLYNVHTSVLTDEEGRKLSDIDVINNSEEALSVIDGAIDTIGSIRATYGAIENKFSTSADRLSGSTNILEGAYSKLVDADIAYEMSEITRTQVLNQTQIALIAQSNQFPQDALKVLERVR